MPTSEPAIRAKAAALGAALPSFRMCEAPQLFAGWADRVALADSLRHAGKPHDEAVAEADAYLGIGSTRPVLLPATVPAVQGDDLWLHKIAAMLGVGAPALAVA